MGVPMNVVQEGKHPLTFRRIRLRSVIPLLARYRFVKNHVTQHITSRARMVNCSRPPRGTTATLPATNIDQAGRSNSQELAKIVPWLSAYKFAE
jgi:hypothetical protein